MHRNRLFVAALLTWIAFALAHAADAPTLDELRAGGVVGERYDGTAIVRDEKQADLMVQALLDSINAKRREIYEARAQKEGAPAAEVAKVYAREIAAKAPAGTWFLGEDRKWVQKK
jgi:uncharacterized protein